MARRAGEGRFISSLARPAMASQPERRRRFRLNSKDEVIVDSTILAAIIGAAGTLLAAIITVRAMARQTSLPSGESRSNSGEAESPFASLEAVSSETGGMTFEEVVAAIRQRYPDAPLGRTAEQGQYYERAKRLTNYRMNRVDPPSYEAVQSNGRVMYLYLGKGGKICCGDKE